MKKAKATQLAAASTAEAVNPARLVEADLTAAEAKLSRLLDSKESIIAEICHYLVDAGGKRLRPTFILLVYRACGGPDAQVDEAIDAAIALELIHSATLLHDDIIDRGLLRRGKPSAFARYGFGPSLIAGDYLFCRAFELCGRFEERLVRTAAQACIQLTEGEVMEGRLRHNAAATLNDYITVIDAQDRVAFLRRRQASRRTSRAFRSGPSIRWRSSAPRWACAFQMVDDLLDILGPEEKIGKPVGSDLRAGIPSLPVVLGVERSAELRALFQDGRAMEARCSTRALDLLRDPEIIATARRLAGEQVAVARAIVGKLEPSLYRDGLATLIDDQVSREV